MGLYLACQRGKHSSCNDSRRCACNCHETPPLDLSIDLARKRLITLYMLGSFLSEEIERKALKA